MQETARMRVMIFFIFLGYYTTYKYNKILINNNKFRLIAIFRGTEVTKVEGSNSVTWNYVDDDEKPRYWLYGKNHYFAAIAPMNSPNIDNLNLSKGKDSKSKDIITGSFDYTNTAEEDLIFATYVHNALASSNPDVNFTFKHLLSKVKISFKNSVDPYVKLKISNLQFSIPEMTTITFAEANVCSNIAGSLNVLTFEKNDLVDNSLIVAPNTPGKSEDFFFIPCKRKYEFEFDVTIVMDGVEPTLYTTHMKAIAEGLDKSGVQLDMGAAYNFITEITPSTIEEGKSSFEVEQIPYWNGKQEGETTVQVFTDLDKIKIASKLGGTVALQNDVPSDGETVEAITVVDDLTILSAVPNDKTAGYIINYNGTSGYLFNVINENTATNNGDRITTLTLGSASEANSVVSIESTGGIATAGVGGEIIINGGTHTTSGSALYKSTGGKIEINKGNFKSTSTATPYELLVGNNSNISVKGGAFYKWDPSDGDGEYKPENKKARNFLVETLEPTQSIYIVTPNKPEYNWFRVSKKYIVQDNDNSDNKENITDAFNDPETSLIELNKDITFDQTFTVSGQEDLTLNMNDHVISGDKEFYSGNIFDYTAITINDGTFLNGGFQITEGSSVILNNCNIDLSTNTATGGRYCLNCGGEAIINGGKFEINTSVKHAYINPFGNAKVFVLYSTWGGTSINQSTDFYKRLVRGNTTGKVVIYAGEFGGDPTEWKAADAVVTKVGNSKWTVQTDGITSTKNDETGKVTTVISFGTFEFDPTPWLASGATVTKTDSQWIVTQPSGDSSDEPQQPEQNENQ